MWKWSCLVVSDSLWPHGHQAPLSMGFSRQEYWSGLPFPFQGIFPTQGSNTGLPHCRQMLYRLSHQGNLDSSKKQRHYFADKGPSSQGYGFSSGHVWMWELDYKESWALKNWCFWTVLLEKHLEIPLDRKEIQAVGRTDIEAETPILWPPDAKSWLIRKRPWCWERLRAGGGGDYRGWDGWMASLTRWTWVWVNSRSWWWTGGPGMLRFMGWQTVRHDWVAELN